MSSCAGIRGEILHRILLLTRRLIAAGGERRRGRRARRRAPRQLAAAIMKPATAKSIEAFAVGERRGLDASPMAPLIISARNGRFRPAYARRGESNIRQRRAAAEGKSCRKAFRSMAIRVAY